MDVNFEQYFEEVPCELRVQGPDRVIRHANRAFREMFGDAVGLPCYQVIKHRDEKCLVCPSQQTFADGRQREREDVVTSTRGQKRNLLCTTSPIHGSEGEVSAVLVMFTDITQMRELQSQLTSIGLLVGSISHGIKGLLTGLDGGIYLVNSGLEKDRPERVTKGWEMVQRNIGRIRSMVLDILYYTKDREMEVVRIDARALADEIGEVLRKKAADNAVSFRIEIAPGVGEFEGDAKAIRATLLNVLENSMEACHSDRSKPRHEVSFVVRREPPWMNFEIEDDGIGMDQETREKVFSLFFSSKGIKGTGLGLFIANRIVDKHGGEIDVESTPGVGTRFQIRVPIIAQCEKPIEVEREGESGS